MFAVFFLERDPLRLQDLPAGAWDWVQTVGGFAMIGLLAWLVFGWYRRRPADRARIPRWQVRFVQVCVALALIAYALVLPLRVYELVQFICGNALLDERFRTPNAGAVEVVWKPAVLALRERLPLRRRPARAARGADAVRAERLRPAVAPHLRPGRPQLQGSPAQPRPLGLLRPAARLPLRQLVHLRPGQARRPAPHLRPARLLGHDAAAAVHQRARWPPSASPPTSASRPSTPS